MSDHDKPEAARTPADEIRAAFAAVAEDAPPTTFSLQNVTAGLHQQRSTRRNWVLGAAAAIAGVAVITTVTVGGSSGSLTAGSAASSSSAAASSSPPMPMAGVLAEQESAATADGQISAAAGDPAPDDAATSGAPAPSLPTQAATAAISCAALPLSDDQTGLITATLAEVAPVELGSDDCVATDDLTAVGGFAGTGAVEGATLTVEVHQPALPPCDSCTKVSDGVDASAAGGGSQYLRVSATSPDGTVVVIAAPAAGETSAPFTVEELAAVAEALLPTI